MYVFFICMVICEIVLVVYVYGVYVRDFIIMFNSLF